MRAAAELIARARLICGDDHVLTSPILLSTYRSDGIRRNGPLPVAAVLPGSAAEVAGVVSACAACEVPFAVRGAGTSHSGGALPIADGVLIVLTRMRRILSVEQDELTVEAGAPLAGLPRPDAGAWVTAEQPLGTVGGHIAETPGIGNISEMALVRPDGSVLRFHERLPGYDVLGAFPGSRGRAGIAVTVTLRAVPTRGARP